VSPPRLKNPAIPKAVSDVVMRAMAPDLTVRYGRATDLLEDILAVRAPRARRTPAPAPAPEPAARARGDDLPRPQPRLRARDTPTPRFCWQCRKPLHARSDRCPFCGEAQ